ncbi:hypothetical protein [Krasilnikovia sp. MM14-A1259]|uniref:hypothetical protein n=1 Tax=Krasilnikovia sp. MM14-A1259 TaxID=3373539 RepID=UPI0038290C0F
MIEQQRPGHGPVYELHNRRLGPHESRYRVRFPSGDERTYAATEITKCTCDDDAATIINALDSAARSLVAACRIAHDYDDEELSAEIVFATGFLVDIARNRLDVTLDPARLEPAFLEVATLTRKDRS